MRSLTSREFQVLGKIAKGWTNAEIGGHLGITEKTVKNIALAVFTKLDVRNRVEATLYHLEQPIQRP